MGYSVKHVIMVTQNVKFAMNAKRALERDGEFVLQHYTKPATAIDALIHFRPDVAILDFRVSNMPARQMIDQLRLVQPAVGVIAAPDHSAVQDLVSKLNIQRVLDIPCPMRKLVALVQEVAREMKANQPDTQEAPKPARLSGIMTNYDNTLEFWVSDGDDGNTKLERAVLSDTGATRLFEQLAAEEPPMPSLQESGTVGDLRASMTDPDVVNRVINALEAQKPQGTDTNPLDMGDIGTDEVDESPVRIILETTLDPTTPMGNFSYETFRASVEARSKPGQKAILPLPSWVKEDRQYIIEPDFLKDDLPEMPSAEYTASVTLLSDSRLIESDPGDLPTDPIQSVRQSRPIEAHEREILEANLFIDEVEETDTQGTQQPQGTQASPVPDEVLEQSELVESVAPEIPVVEQPDRAMPFVQHDENDKRIAQLALTLTQVSLELAVEATLLARDGQIVAYAGKLPQEEIEELRDQVADDWDAAAGRDRIRFVTLPSTKVDYMLYSRYSVDGYTLSMIFPGSMPVQMIRRQGGKLAVALSSAPELNILPDPLLLEEVGSRTPHSFVWLLNDPDISLTADLCEVLHFELQKSLLQEGWLIHAADVQADYVYLFADVPESLAHHNITRELMRLSASILHDENPQIATASLWHDSFLLIKPGRALGDADIQRFIKFARR